MYNVKNCDESIYNYKYVIVRDCTDEGLGYWYYGADNNLYRCSMIIKEIKNAFVTESENVACLP